jgi:hypothetical protein
MPQHRHRAHASRRHNNINTPFSNSCPFNRAAGQQGDANSSGIVMGIIPANRPQLQGLASQKPDISLKLPKNTVKIYRKVVWIGERPGK